MHTSRLTITDHLFLLTTNYMNEFVFTSSMPSCADDLLVQVNPNIETREALLNWFSRTLEFPSYFGGNWDAFEECMRDLSWLPQCKVVLFHSDVPLRNDLKNKSLYLTILASVIQHWKSDASHQLIVAFAPACKTEVQAALETPQ
jgi:RNAse (barnase) inhibitor barstar